MKPCPYCDWNDDHPYHYPDCPALEIASLRARVAVLEKVAEAAESVWETNEYAHNDEALTAALAALKEGT